MSAEVRTAVRVRVRDRVAEVTLVDVGRRNSCNPVLVEQLVRVCDELRHDRSVHVVVLRAEGPVFSAGGDVDSLLEPAGDPTAVYAGFAALAALPVPVLAAVHAPVIGAGVNFLLACDAVVAARSATFDIRFLDVGIHPGGGYLTRMQERIGRQGTAALILFGDVVTAEEAQGCGLVWRCVADEELGTVVGGLAARVAGRDRELLRRTKATLALGPAMTVGRTAAEVEQIAQGWSQRQPAYLAGVERLRARVHRSP
ncbi:enoyl-CoA hydratase-related protein [Trujillonella endophytica]|uniref:Enoyl-CoA hydratase n=1 Tax=Trujillonella endophytica TaxID=673521 RepID=A0A1H8T276_9ACTN|nr:enoyl-CoA hydratase-related protein [Trujillella endophytica]SEO85159.1 enoyl-CoA hydratase [Trujillella endophytica]